MHSNTVRTAMTNSVIGKSSNLFTCAVKMRVQLSVTVRPVRSGPFSHSRFCHALAFAKQHRKVGIFTLEQKQFLFSVSMPSVTFSHDRHSGIPDIPTLVFSLWLVCCIPCRAHPA
jgi:hypothetical protein